MITIALRTDNPQAEMYLYDNNQELGHEIWQAHRELSATIHTKLASLLSQFNKDWQDIGAILFYEGPGSFTGLRIGVSVANALGASLVIPVVSTTGDSWRDEGLEKLKVTGVFTPVEPFYGSDPHTTPAKK